jgi:hypothetical protein
MIVTERPILRRDGLEGHLAAALEVEAECRPLLEGRPGDREQPNRHEGGGDERDDEDCCATGHCGRSG